MTLLTVIQDACDEIGFDAPDYVVGSTDQTARQALALANRSGKSLAQRFPWQQLTREFTHTTVSAELQGLVEAIMPGFNWDLYQTIWNRSNGGMGVGGPLYPDEWQARKAAGISGPYPSFRIRGAGLYLLPIPTAGQTIAGEYVTRFFCQSAAGAAQERWAADTDTGILPEDLLSADLKWRLLRAKGMDYAEEKMEAELLINNAMARNGSNRTLSLEGGEFEGRGGLGGVIVPEGNW